MERYNTITNKKSRKRFNKSLPLATAKDSIVFDKLMDLPEHLIRHICSFLGAEERANLTFTSKWFKQICLSAPTLDINSANLRYDSAKKVKFLKFLTNFVTLRQGTKLNRLSISWTFSDDKDMDDDLYYIMTLVEIAAAKCNVEEVELFLENAQVGKKLSVSLDVFCPSQALRHLKLDLNYARLDLEHPDNFANLRYLCLKKVSVVIVEAQPRSFGEWVSSSCKHLKTLYLEQVCGIQQLRISSSSLEYICIENCMIKSLDISAKSLKSLWLNRAFISSASLKLDAPNLLDLTWGVSSRFYDNVGELNSLQNVQLVAAPSSYIDRRRLKSLISRITRVRQSLWISTDCIKDLDKADCLPLMLNEFQSLELAHWALADYLIPSIALFLRGLPPGLKKLWIRQYATWRNAERKSIFNWGQASGYKATFWESQNFRFIQGLELVVFDLLGGENEEELLKYLLENAKNLKKLVISSKAPLPTEIATKLLTMAAVRGAHIHSHGKMITFEIKC